MILINVDVNYLAVVIAAVASMALGFAWYSQMLFGKAWMKEKGFSAADLKSAQKGMGKLYAVSFVVALVNAYVLTHIIVMSVNFFHDSPIVCGLMSGFWTWLGFMMPVQVTATIFGNKNWKLLGIDTGYQLVSNLVMGLVLGYMMGM